MRSSKVSSMATIRWSSGMRAMSTLSSVVLPLAVPPLTRILRRVCNTRSASSRMCAGSAPCAISCTAEKDGVPKRRTVMATRGLVGGQHRWPRATRRPTGRRGSAAGNVLGHVEAHATLTLPAIRNARMSRSSSAPLVAARRPARVRAGELSLKDTYRRGAVTRRAVAQCRSRASGLTCPLAEAIRGFGLGFVVPFSPFRRGM